MKHNTCEQSVILIAINIFLSRNAYIDGPVWNSSCCKRFSFFFLSFNWKSWNFISKYRIWFFLKFNLAQVCLETKFQNHRPMMSIHRVQSMSQTFGSSSSIYCVSIRASFRSKSHCLRRSIVDDNDDDSDNDIYTGFSH